MPISTDLTSLDGGSIAAADHPLQPTFAASGDAADLVQVENAGYTLSLSLVGAVASKATKVAASADVADGTAVRYPDAVDGADLLFQVGQQAVYQTVELAAAPDDQLSYEWLIDGPGLHAVRKDSGEIEFRAPNGDVVFYVPGPVMWDSLGGAGGMADSASTPVDYTLTAAGKGRWRVELTPDMAWLRDAARVYPVSIDPTIYPGSGMVATYKENNFSYNYASVPRVGNTKETGTCCAWRTVLRYPMNAYFGKRLTNAYLVANWTYGSTANQVARVWWATAFNFNGNGAAIEDFTIGTQGIAQGLGMFDLVASILNNSDWYTYLMLTGDEDNAVYSRKDLSTYIVITYVDPAVVTGVTGTTPTSPQAGPLTPIYVDDIVMQATGINHLATQTSQLFRYHFASSNGGKAWDSPWVAPGPYRVPAAALSPDGNYWYWIDSMDSGRGSPVKPFGNPTYMFHTKAGPATPSAITVDGEPLTADVTSSVERPTLGATVSEPDGGQVWAVFTVKRDGIVIMDSVAGSKVTVAAGHSGVSSVTLPYAITAGGHYTVEARAFDGHLSSEAATSDPHWFTGPPQSGGSREIPGDQDTNTGATS